MSSVSAPPRPTDNAFLGPLRGGSKEPSHSGALSFMRRRYSRDLLGHVQDSEKMSSRT
jgi:hypothetical protein